MEVSDESQSRPEPTPHSKLAQDMWGVKALDFLTSHCRIPQVEEGAESRCSEPNRYI